jgi:hypothetical protein
MCSVGLVSQLLKKIGFFWVDDIIKKAFESSKMEIKAF